MSSNNRNRLRAGGVGMAVGAALAAALASTPGVASADSSTDPFSWVDQLLGGLSVPAQTTTSDMQISIDGTDLFPTAGNTATAESGPLDIAIAIGNGADASAGIPPPCFGLCPGLPPLQPPPGFFDFAFADGASSTATADPLLFNSAIVIGADSSAGAGPGDFDLAAAFGDMLNAIADNGNFPFFATDILF